MSVLVTPPDTKEIKTILQDSISHGSVQKIANILGVSHSVISNRFNRNREEKVYIAEAAREFWAMACADPEAYEIVKAYFFTLLDSWGKPAPASDKGLSDVLIEVHEKLNELDRARFVEGASVKVQRQDASEVIAKMAQFIAGLGKQLELTGESEVSRFQRKAQ